MASLELTQEHWDRLETAFSVGALDDQILRSLGKDHETYRAIERLKKAWENVPTEAKSWLVSEMELAENYEGRRAKYDFDLKIEQALEWLKSSAGAPPNFAYRRVARELREIWIENGLGKKAVPGRLVADRRLEKHERSGSSVPVETNPFVNQLADVLLKFDPEIKEHQIDMIRRMARTAVQRYAEFAPEFVELSELTEE